MKKIILFIGFALLLTGCTVPGNQLITEGKNVVLQPDSQSFNLNQIANIYPITPMLIQHMNGLGFNVSSTLTSQDPQLKSYEYRIGAGDVLNIIVWDHPELAGSTLIGTSASGTLQTSTFTVNKNGNIYYPLVGKVFVANKTPSEVRSLLRQKLTRYIRNPQLDVRMAQYRSKNVIVNGAVNHAQQISITDVPLTLLNAISIAGGFSANADTRHITWTHNGTRKTLSLQQLLKDDSETLLTGGDVIFIPSIQDQQVYVMGEVGKQGSMNIGATGLNLTQAISNAQGLNQNLADATGVFVLRMHPEDKDHKLISIYQLNLKDATAYALGTRFPLRNQDVIYITSTPLTRWNRVLSQILPSLNTIGISAGTAKDLYTVGLFK